MPLGLLPSIQNANSSPLIKPQGLCMVNPDHPLCSRDAGLILAVFFNEGRAGQHIDHSPFGHVLAQPGSSTWASWVQGRGARALNYVGGAKEIRFAHRTGQPFIGDQNAVYSSLAVVSLRSQGTQSCIWSIGEQTDSNSNQGMIIDNAKHLGQLGGAVSSTLAVAADSKWHTVGISQSAAAARTFMVDGATQSNTTNVISGTIGATQPLGIGRDYINSAVNAVDDFDGLIEAVFVWNKALSVNALASLGFNPYQVVVAKPRRIAFSFGGVPAVVVPNPPPLPSQRFDALPDPTFAWWETSSLNQRLLPPSASPVPTAEPSERYDPLPDLNYQWWEIPVKPHPLPPSASPVPSHQPSQRYEAPLDLWASGVPWQTFPKQIQSVSIVVSYQWPAGSQRYDAQPGFDFSWWESVVKTRFPLPSTAPVIPADKGASGICHPFLEDRIAQRSKRQREDDELLTVLAVMWNSR